VIVGDSPLLVRPARVVVARGEEKGIGARHDDVARDLAGAVFRVAGGVNAIEQSAPYVQPDFIRLKRHGLVGVKRRVENPWTLNRRIVRIVQIRGLSEDLGDAVGGERRVAEVDEDEARGDISRSASRGR
jgi:hypothetical protein